jgi:hypothetical protein
MSQVNLLSVDVGQNSDMQGSKGEAPIKNQAKANAFSNAMDQHYPRKSLAESDNNTKQGGNFASKAAEHQQQVIKDDDSLTSVKATKADDAHTLPVPLPIDDESLTDKLTASANAHTLPVPFPIDNESLAVQLKAESTDKYDARTLRVPTTPLYSENREFKQVEGTLKGDSVLPISYQQSYLDFQSQKYQQQESQPKIGSTDNIANDDTVDLLKMLNGAQQLLTKTAAEQSNIEQNGKNSAVVTEKILASNKIMAESERSKNQVDEQNLLVKNAKAEYVKASPNASDAQQSQLLAGSKNTAKQLTENATANVANSLSALDAKPITSTETGIMGLANERGLVENIDLIAKPVSSQNLDREAAVILDKNQAAEQVSGNRELHNSISDDDSKLDLANAKTNLLSELNLVHKTDLAQSNEVKVQAAELIKAKVAEFVQVNGNEPTQDRVINQSTATAISISTSDVKGDANQKTVVNNDVSKLVNVVGEEQKSSKNEGDKQLPQADKVLSAFNQTLDTQAAKPTVSSAEIAAQQEQRFESTINQLTTNNVQTQKSITAMNTETIAIYRKDFANAIKDKVLVMINQKIQQVEIKLDPPEMGNIHVRVNLQNEQAAVQFVVQNQQAKEALEQNMGKLRDMLAESGVDVGEASIEQRQAKEQNGNGFDQQTNNDQNTESTEDNFNENDNSMVNVVKASSTGIDYYA